MTWYTELVASVDHYCMPSIIPSNRFISFCSSSSAIKIDLSFHLTKYKYCAEEEIKDKNKDFK